MVRIKCSVCKLVLDKDQLLKVICRYCKQHYHAKCVAAYYKFPDKWAYFHCPYCRRYDLGALPGYVYISTPPDVSPPLTPPPPRYPIKSKVSSDDDDDNYDDYNDKDDDENEQEEYESDTSSSVAQFEDNKNAGAQVSHVPKPEDNETGAQESTVPNFEDNKKAFIRVSRVPNSNGYKISTSKISPQDKEEPTGIEKEVEKKMDIKEQPAIEKEVEEKMDLKGQIPSEKEVEKKMDIKEQPAIEKEVEEKMDLKGHIPSEKEVKKKMDIKEQPAIEKEVEEKMDLKGQIPSKKEIEEEMDFIYELLIAKIKPYLEEKLSKRDYKPVVDGAWKSILHYFSTNLMQVIKSHQTCEKSYNEAWKELAAYNNYLNRVIGLVMDYKKELDEVLSLSEVVETSATFLEEALQLEPLVLESSSEESSSEESS